APSNETFRDTSVSVFHCPSMIFHKGDPPPGWGSYAVSTGTTTSHFSYASFTDDFHNGAIVDIRASDAKKTSVRLISSLDGTSNTFLAGELDYGLVGYSGDAGCFDRPDTGKGGRTEWAQGYPVGYSHGTVSGVFNADRLVAGCAEWYTFRSGHPGGVNMV